MVDLPIAGVAGSSLTIQLGHQGFRVGLCERRRFPREKPVGEGLMPADIAGLEQLGLRLARLAFRPLRTQPRLFAHLLAVSGGAQTPFGRSRGPIVRRSRPTLPAILPNSALAHASGRTL